MPQLTYTAPDVNLSRSRAAGSVSDHLTEPPTQQTAYEGHPSEHPTAELPTLSAAEAADLLAPPKALWETIAGHVVTALLVLAVVAVFVVNVGPIFLGYKVFTVLSGSMEPNIHVGSEVIATPVQADSIREGDVVTFTPPGRPNILVTHRVVKIITTSDGKAWITKGDANGVADIWQVPVQGKGLKFRFTLPLLGYAFVMLESPIGRVLFIVAPALLLAAVTLNDLWKPRVPAPPSGS